MPCQNVFTTQVFNLFGAPYIVERTDARVAGPDPADRDHDDCRPRPEQSACRSNSAAAASPRKPGKARSEPVM